jgi:transcriptional regulator with XRE-family HTH domain
LRILGARIRYYRKQNRVTQVELAEQLGVAPRYIGNIEQGNRKPSLDMLISICLWFGVELSDILPLVSAKDLCLKDKVIYEITLMCRALDMSQVDLIKFMVSTMNT